MSRRSSRRAGRRQRPVRAKAEARAGAKGFQRFRSVGGSKASKSERSVRHDLLRLRRKLTYRLVGALLLIAGLAFVSSQMVVEVEISTPSTPGSDLANYRDAVQQHLRRHPVQRLRLSLDEAGLLRSMQQSHPEVSRVEVGVARRGQAHAKIELREAVASWQVKGVQQFVDRHGVVFKDNFGDSPFIRIVDDSGLDYEDSSTIASQSFLTFTGQLVGLGQQYDYTVKSVTIPRGAIRDIEVKFKGQPYTVLMNTGQPAGEQYEDVSRVMDWLDSSNRQAKEIDVRVSRRASYR